MGGSDEGFSGGRHRCEAGGKQVLRSAQDDKQELEDSTYFTFDATSCGLGCSELIGRNSSMADFPSRPPGR